MTNVEGQDGGWSGLFHKILGLNWTSINQLVMGDKTTTRFFKEPAEKKLAVLGDVSVRVNETYCLEEREWLHDNLIEFYLEYLRHVKHRDVKDMLEIIGPTVTQCIKMSQCAVVVNQMVEPLNLKEKSLVLIPVNNANRADAEGSHWSLLVMIPSTGHFYHLDTLDMNKECAKTLAIKLCAELKFQDPNFEHFTGTRQDNAVDCGLYVLLNADKAIQHFVKSSSREGFVPAGKSDIADMRQAILNIIKEVADSQSATTTGQQKAAAGTL